MDAQYSNAMPLLFWGFLGVYGLVMWLLSPKASTIGSFFRGEDKNGRSASAWMLTLSIFISWIFAKSVTNAANLGAVYGIVGGVAYAVYWLCIPLAGFVIYRLRRRYAAKSGTSSSKLFRCNMTPPDSLNGLTAYGRLARQSLCNIKVIEFFPESLFCLSYNNSV